MKFLDELPKSTNGSVERTRKLLEFAAELRANPGRWAEYPTSLSGKSVYARANQIKNGNLASFPTKGEFDAAVRDKILYVRAIKKPRRRTQNDGR